MLHKYLKFLNVTVNIRFLNVIVNIYSFPKLH